MDPIKAAAPSATAAAHLPSRLLLRQARRASGSGVAETAAAPIGRAPRCPPTSSSSSFPCVATAQRAF